jgi:hypothetical protein
MGVRFKPTLFIVSYQNFVFPLMEETLAIWQSASHIYNNAQRENLLHED